MSPSPPYQGLILAACGKLAVSEYNTCNMCTCINTCSGFIGTKAKLLYTLYNNNNALFIVGNFIQCGNGNVVYLLASTVLDQCSMCFY